LPAVDPEAETDDTHPQASPTTTTTTIPEVSEIGPNIFKEVEKRKHEPDVVYQTFVVSWTFQLKKLVDFVEQPEQAFETSSVKNLAPVVHKELERLDMAMKVARLQGGETERNFVLKEVDRLEKEMEETAKEHDYAKLMQVAYLIRDLLHKKEDGASKQPANTIELKFAPTEAAHLRKIDAAINEHWGHTTHITHIPEEEEKLVQAAVRAVGDESDYAHFASAYGEVMPIGLRRIGHAMGLAGDDGVATTGGDGVFMDLGSGHGRIVVQAYLEWPAVRRSIGVELSATRIKHAQKSWQSMLNAGSAESLRKASEEMALLPDKYTSDVHQSVDFLEEDLMLTDISEVTHVLVNSVLFPESLLERLSKKLVEEGNKLCMVASFKKIRFDSPIFEEVVSFNAEQTWSTTLETAPVLHLYSRDGCGKNVL